MRLKTWAPIFIIIAIILAIVGYVKEDYFFYIRAVIFSIGGGVAWWLDVSGRADKINKRILKLCKGKKGRFLIYL